MLRKLRGAEHGITGLETAIILIAFVVVASVFAYTVLSAGIFSSEKAKEAIHEGIEQTRSSMVIEGGIHASGVEATTLDNADSAWTASANVTATTDTTDKTEGTASADLAIAGAFGTGLIAYSNLGSETDISSHYSARLWIKSDTTLAADVLRLVIDDTVGCGSPLETLNISALTADTWKQIQFKLSDPSALDEVKCVGIDAASDPGAITVNVDLVEAPGEVTQLHFLVVNALGGDAIDMSTTTDADGDGLISDETTQSHHMSIDFVDSSQLVGNLAWTKIELGQGDGDNLLEVDERMGITVQTTALDPMPVGGTKFKVHLLPAEGSTFSFERTLPRVIDARMDLN